jgi:hypothetical protein
MQKEYCSGDDGRGTLWFYYSEFAWPLNLSENTNRLLLYWDYRDAPIPLQDGKFYLAYSF